MAIETLKLQNFKSIHNAELDIKPITILCGMNSCGKSSVIKSLLLFKQAIEECEYEADPVPLNGKYTKLGTLNNIVTRGKNETIVEMRVPFSRAYYRRYYGSFDNSFLDKYRNGQIFYSVTMDKELNKLSNIKLGFKTEKVSDDAWLEFSRIDDDFWKIHFENYDMMAKSLYYYMMDDDPEDKIGPKEKIKRYTYIIQELDNVRYFFHPIGIAMDLGGVIDYLNLPPEFDKGILMADTMIRWKEHGFGEDEIYSFIKYYLPIFVQELNGIHYLGPLRAEPSRQYLYNDIIRDVGINGENTPEIIRRYAKYAVKSKIKTVQRKEEYSIQYTKKVRERRFRDEINDCLKYLDIKTITFTDGQLKVGEDNISDVGFGISQVLPIVVESAWMDPGETLITEQPELHLHPAMQMNLADIILAEALAGKQFLIETHSEHIVNRLVRRIVEDGIDGEHYGLNKLVQIYFVEPSGEGARFIPVEIDANIGITNWPSGFFDQGTIESRKIILSSALKRKNQEREAK